MTRNPLPASLRVLQALLLQPMTTRTLAEVLTLRYAYAEDLLRHLVKARKVWPVGVAPRPRGQPGTVPILYGVRL